MYKQLCVFTFAILLMGLASHVLAQSKPIGWWKFDEGSGTIATDSAGNNDGTIDNLMWVNDPERGWVLDFKAEGYVYLPTAAFSPLDEQITITFWQFGASDWERGYFFQGVEGFDMRIGGLHRGGRVTWQAGDDDRIHQKVEPAIMYSRRWNHWAFTKNAHTRQMKIYVNGEEVGSLGEQPGWMSGGALTAFAVCSRADDQKDNEEDRYVGLMSDFRVYDIALNQREIRDLMTGSPDTVPPSPNPMSWDTTPFTVSATEISMNYYIATSRDAVDWDLDWVCDDKPLVPRGPAGSWDKDGIHPTSTIITKDDRHWIYYCGMSERFAHKAPEGLMGIGLASVRLDGFIYLEAKDELGTVVTKPFKLEGNTLKVNVDASDGEFFVEVLDTEGKPISGFSAAEATTYAEVDALRLKPQWKNYNDLSALKD